MSGRPLPRAWRLMLPKWLMLHVSVIAACIAMVLLGRWQWHVAHTHNGNIQYYAYAFQWWAFVGFALVMWYRVVRDYLRSGKPDAGAADRQRAAEAQPQSYRAYVPPVLAPQPADDDPERQRFNAYLAQLHAADQVHVPERAKGSE